jgi:hypothetical protein
MIKFLEMDIYPVGSTLQEKIQIDYAKGYAQELEKIPLVIDYFNRLLNIDLSTYKLSTSRYSCIDWTWKSPEGDEVYIELKGRRNVKHHYSTTIFGQNKYNKMKKMIVSNPKCRCFVVFNYTDVMSYYEVSLSSDDEIKQNVSKVSYRRGYEQTNNVEVSVDLLTDITTFDYFL